MAQCRVAIRGLGLLSRLFTGRPVSARPRTRLREFGPHVRALFAAAGTGEVWLYVRQPDIIGPTVSVGLDVMAE